jgi:hypothetical protein
MEILRAYKMEKGKELCIKDEKSLLKILANPDQDLDLDIKDSRGHVKMTSSRELIGCRVRVGSSELEIPEH